MATAVVLLAVFVVMLGNTAVLSMLGLFGRTVGLSEVQVGIVISSSALLFFLTSSCWGRLSDRKGRRPAILWGLAGAASSAMLFAALFTVEPGTVAAPVIFTALLGARLLYGLLCGGVQPAGIAYMADVSTDTSRSKGGALVGLAVGLGGMTGPLLVAASVERGFAAPLVLSGALTVLVALAALVFLRDPPRRTDVVAREDAGPPCIGLLFALAFVVHLSFAALQATNAFYVQDLLDLEAIDAVQNASLLSATFATSSFVAQGLAVGVLTWKPTKLLSIGLAVCLIASIGCVLAIDLGSLLVAFALLGGGFAWVQTGLVAGASLANGSGRRGQAAGQLHAAMAAAWIGGPLMGAALYRFWIAGPFTLAAVAMALGLLAVVLRRSTAPRASR